MYEKYTDEWIRQNQNDYRYWQLEKLRNGLNVTAIVIGLVYVILRRQSLVLTILCWLIPAVCLVLDICFPAYFTLTHTKWQMQNNTRVIRISLVEPCFLSLGLLAVATHLNMHFVHRGTALLGCILLSAIVTGILLLLAPKFRADRRDVWMFALLLTLTGLGITGQANYWLDTEEPEIVLAVVEDVDDNYHTGRYSVLWDTMIEVIGTQYTCTVRLPDGDTAEFSIRSTRRVLVGTEIPLDHMEGALDLECYCLRTDRMDMSK